MLYNAPVKGDDGLYFVKALTDEKRKCFIQLNGVTIADASNEITFDLKNDSNRNRVQLIDDLNFEAARENCESWFGKQLTDDVLRSAYTSSIVNDQLTGECIAVTKVYNSDQELVDFSFVGQGKKSSVILEFAGLWFAKKAFGPAWNIFQVKVFDEPNLEVYPDDYAFNDEDVE